MPNWCNNYLKVTSPVAEDIQKFKKKAKPDKEKNEETCLSLEKLCPRPKSEEKNWYDWNCDNWGTKWDVDASLLNSSDNELNYSFDSAWSPPVEAFEKISKYFPSLTFFLEFEELGMGFAGNASITDGDCNIEDEEILYGICPECLEETQLLRGECAMCGAAIDKVIKPIGKILEHSDIQRKGSPGKK